MASCSTTALRSSPLRCAGLLSDSIPDFILSDLSRVMNECSSGRSACLHEGRTRSSDCALTAIVLCRHVCLIDASLSSLLYQQAGRQTRGVVMAEMLFDSGFDLLDSRTGLVFIPRDYGPQALSVIAQLGRNLDNRMVAALFPEGRLFRGDLRDRLLEKLPRPRSDGAVEDTFNGHDVEDTSR